jgi:hypothetical protein
MKGVNCAVRVQHLMIIAAVFVRQAIEIVVQQKRRSEQAEGGIVVDCVPAIAPAKSGRIRSGLNSVRHRRNIA